MSNPERHCRVLVIDDNEDIRESVAAVITLLGHEVVAAGDGEDGMQAGRTFLPDLVLMDVGLPGMSGYDVVKLMRAEPWGQRAVLAAMTGWAQESDRAQAKAAGFDVHVPKPVELRTLRELIARAAALPGAEEAAT